MRRLGQTPSQTVGPYFSMRLGAEGQHVLAGPEVPGRHVRIEGRVLDHDGVHIEDALLEVWQADAEGRYRHPDDRWGDDLADLPFTGFGRAVTDFRTGVYVIETIKPGNVPGPGGSRQAPHLSLIIQARGMLEPSFTRVYFSDEGEQNERDQVLSRVPAERRHTLLAELLPGSGAVPTYRFDIRFGGESETVFLDF